MLLALQSLDPQNPYPITSYFGDIGHPRATNKSAERDYVVGLIRQWFAYYLHASGTEPLHVVRAAITRGRDQPFNPADVITVATYAALATGSVSKQFDGSATLVNPVGAPSAGFSSDPVTMEAWRELLPLSPPPEPAIVDSSLGVFTVGVAELNGGLPLLIAGQPSVSLHAATLAPRVQLDVRLIDVAPDGSRELITRGTFLLEGPTGPTGNESVPVTIPTYGNLWEAPASHALRLEITNLDSPYLAPSRIPSATVITDVRLDLPTR
jgi:hypothetical protein